ncbi:MAG: dihydrodipicolinate synthase family protein [Rhodobacteraceae bacterium]|jgi:4-hydroxy-tetrahydrodipicolinate synthase|nr:dihydrodipicolinate synthase family protein [Paracoccaceae bacterium]
MPHTPRLYVPAITPFGPDLAVDHTRLVAHSRLLLDDGADGLAPFGTTSEATSMSVEERTAALEALVAGGIAPGRLIPGTGCAALPDTIRLTRHALALGVKGALMLPPFYYKGVPEDGVFAAYARTIEAAGPGLRLYLYHIPQMSGVPITLSLIARLVEAFPGVVAGLKDSSGNWENTAAVIAAFPAIEVFSASESLLPRNVAAGGAGCISATANVNARGIARLIRAIGTDDEAAALADAGRIRAAFEAMPVIPAVKAAIALRLGDPAYATTRPPLAALAPAHAATLEAAAALCFPAAPQSAGGARA